MKLSSLSLQSFRNLDATRIEFCDGFNILFGSNAQGKTNLLESIFLLGTLKSFRLAKNSELINWGSSFSLIKGKVESDGVSHNLALLIEKGGKKVRVDAKTVNRLAEFFGLLTVSLFCPEELGMVRGVPDLRRRFLDRAIFAGDIHYLTSHHEYSRIHRQRNVLLKSGDFDSLEPWNMQLAQAGARLTACRIAYIKEIAILLENAYRQITGTADVADISYRSGVSGYSSDAAANTKLILDELERLQNQEKIQRTTLAGPHRDDVAFSLNGRPLKQAASQGQQRCYVLALKMAEIEYLFHCHGQAPILLLDDMTSELDRERTDNLLHFLTEKKMQVFITTTSPDLVGRIGQHDRLRMFHVKQGSIQIQNQD